METKPVISYKNIITAVGAFVIVAPLLLAGVMWSSKLAPAMKTRMARKAASAPLIKEARDLGLTYESALADPKRASGRPAVWCLRRVIRQGSYGGVAGPAPAAPASASGNFLETYYDGKEDKSVYITNPGRMYDMASSSHHGCVKTLVTIKTITFNDFGRGLRPRLEAEFVDYP